MIYVTNVMVNLQLVNSACLILKVVVVMNVVIIKQKCTKLF